MTTIDMQTKILARTLYEIRVLLANYLGSTAEGDPAVRYAAHLAYALHNQALELLDNKSFNVNEAINQITVVDKMFSERLNETLRKLT